MMEHARTLASVHASQSVNVIRFYTWTLLIKSEYRLFIFKKIEASKNNETIENYTTEKCSCQPVKIGGYNTIHWGTERSIL